jgi:flagellar biosynthesis protein FlhB
LVASRRGSSHLSVVCDEDFALSRTLVNLLLDALLMLLLCSLIGSACVLQFVFPPGTEAKGWKLWGMDYNAWANCEFATLCVILLAVVVHVMLHWNWVCSVIATRLLKLKGSSSRPDEGTQTLYGVSTLIAFLSAIGILIATATLSIQSPIR